MKNLFKTGFIALTIAISLGACKGNNSTHAPDSTRVDSTTSVPNGSPDAIDTGIDKSGSGGTDTVKKD